ncbi:MAG: hypothetical protein E7H78_24240 [Klebsiella michiganensis]|nr:hypothetical protein [Klebsiella michiganensis]
MNDSSIQKLKDLASNTSSDLMDILMQAKVLAIKFGDREFRQWIDSEANGYTGSTVTPDYRNLQTKVKYQNTLGYWVPVDFSSAKEIDVMRFSSIRLTESILELQKVIDTRIDEKEIPIEMPAHYSSALAKYASGRTEFASFVNLIKIEQILAAVRYRILDWVLEMDFKHQEDRTEKLTNCEPLDIKGNLPSASNTYITNYHGPVSNAVAVASGDVLQKNTTSNAFYTLANELQNKGISENDISELEQIVKQSPIPKTKEEVEKGFGTWIGKITGQAYSGSLKIAGAVAPALLTNALCHYFNIPV